MGSSTALSKNRSVSVSMLDLTAPSHVGLLALQGLGFRVYGLGFGVWVLGFGVSGLRGLGFRGLEQLWLADARRP